TGGTMTPEEILKLPSMPAVAPSYPLGPYRFINREFMIITYETDPVLLRAAVPEPLVPNAENYVLYEWIRMPDSSGFGDYTESGIVIPCTFNGEPINYTAQMYLDDQPPIDGGREIWGFPKKYALPKLEVASDTLTGTLSYAGQSVAMGTMAYKWQEAPGGCEAQAKGMTKTSCNLKIIPDVDGSPKICQLVAYNLENITVKGVWVSPARLQLIPHVNAPVADLPILRIVGGKHFVSDLTLPHGRVLFDYIKDAAG
uniref:acetoacetate decarboxylase n=1 Tax=Sandarakinorhabdus limnophila TaxID=210512 RepID=UPI0037C50471